MRFTISPCTSQGDTVFLIYDEAGEVRYRVTRSKKPAGAVLLLTDSQGTAAAKIKQRVFPPIIRYGISPAEGKNLSVTLRISGNGIPQQLVLGGVTWHFRGVLVARNFDVIDVDSSVLLSHQKCWKDRMDCFAVEIRQPAFEVPLLCVCLCVDLTTEGDINAVVAIN